MIEVVNVNTAQCKYTYIGRSKRFGTSPLGNPYRIGRDGDREAVIAQYRRWLWAVIQREEGPAYDELLRLVDISASSNLVLGCHCAPKACHGDVIKAAIEWLKQQS